MANDSGAGQHAGSGAADLSEAGGLVGASVSGTEDAMLEGAGVAAGDSNPEDRTPRNAGSTPAPRADHSDDGLTEEPAEDSATGDDIAAADATGSGMMGNPG